MYKSKRSVSTKTRAKQTSPQKVVTHSTGSRLSHVVSPVTTRSSNYSTSTRVTPTRGMVSSPVIENRSRSIQTKKTVTLLNPSTSSPLTPNGHHDAHYHRLPPSPIIKKDLDLRKPFSTQIPPPSDIKIKPPQDSVVNSNITTKIPPNPTTTKKGLLHSLGLDSAEAITLKAEDHAKFNRWKIVPAAVMTHLSLGSIFAWSIFNQPLMHINGIFEPIVSDWSLTQIMPVFSTTMAAFGLSSMTLGRLGFNEKYGPKVTGLVGGSLFAGAFALSSFATATHSLPLLYAGYGLMGGLAVGAAYVGPIASLMKWFPDKKGLASAMAVMGFGAGGIFAAQFIEKFLNKFRELPQFAGKLSDLKTKVIDGKMYATIDGIDREIIIASRAALNKLGKAGELLEEGAYFAGTGDVGISKTFLALGCMYTMAIVLSALSFKLPHARYDPTQPGNVKPIENVATSTTTTTTTTTTDAATDEEKAKRSTAVTPLKPKFDYIADKGDITPGVAIKTRQFWLLWTGMLCNSAAAYAVIGAGKTMMLDVYSNAFPLIVTSAFAATFVSMISAFNLSGRLVWGGASDKIGRKRTFDLLWGLGIPFYLGIPLASHLLADGGSSALPLALFYGSVCLAIANFGGSAAISPAYLSDLFGSKYAAANAGQLLSYLMISGYLGPMTCATLRDLSIKQSIEKLSLLVDEASFISAFGQSKDRLNELIMNKTVTIPKMMELCPPGTQDPTPFLYDTTFMTMAALQFVALMCNQSIKKVDDKYFQMSNDAQNAASQKAKITVVDAEYKNIPNQDQSTSMATKPPHTPEDLLANGTITDVKGVELDMDGIKKDIDSRQDRAKIDLSKVKEAMNASAPSSTAATPQGA